MHTYISYFLYPSPIDGELGGLFNLTHEYGCNKHVCASRHVCVAMLTYSFASIHRSVQLSYGSSTFTLFLRTFHIDFSHLFIYFHLLATVPMCRSEGNPRKAALSFHHVVTGTELRPAEFVKRTCWLMGNIQQRVTCSSSWRHLPSAGIVRYPICFCKCWESNPELPTLAGQAVSRRRPCQAAAACLS